MATADDYADWIVKNEDKKGTEDFNTVVRAYQEALAEETKSKGPAVPDNSKYKDHPVSTFAANAINALTFGLPEYLNKTITPATWAEGQKYQEANPMAANLGTATGDVAGVAIPAVGGAVKGAQLGVKGVNKLMEKFGQNLPELAKLYGKSQAGITGATMGAQAGSALPGIVQGDVGKAVAVPAVINEYANKIPYINHLGPLTGPIVPAAAGMAASGVAGMKTGYTPSPQEAKNLLDSGDERTINIYGGRQRLESIIRPNAFNSGFVNQLGRMG
jgi:hypothetical protein